MRAHRSQIAILLLIGTVGAVHGGPIFDENGIRIKPLPAQPSQQQLSAIFGRQPPPRPAGQSQVFIRPIENKPTTPPVEFPPIRSGPTTMTPARPSQISITSAPRSTRQTPDSSRVGRANRQAPQVQVVVRQPAARQPVAPGNVATRHSSGQPATARRTAPRSLTTTSVPANPLQGNRVIANQVKPANPLQPARRGPNSVQPRGHAPTVAQVKPVKPASVSICTTVESKTSTLLPSDQL